MHLQALISIKLVGFRLKREKRVPLLEPVEVLEELLLIMHVVAAPHQNGNVIF
jgi:hypothetical protein